MMRAASWSCALVALFLAAPALAGEVTIGAFSGPGAAPVRAQVSAMVCDQVDCVLASAKGKKAGKKKPAPVLSGKVAKTKKSVEISLVAAGKPAWKKSYPLAAGKLSDDNLEKLTAQVVKSVGAKAPPPPPPAPEPAPEPVAVAPTHTASTSSTGEERKAASDDWAQKSDDSKKPEAEAASESESGGESKLPTVFASANIDLLSRGFSFSSLSTQNLHEYSGFPIAAPHLHLDLYPLARLTHGLLTGLGLEADLAFTLGLKAVLSNTDFPSSILRFSGAIKFRIPVTSSGIAIVPAVGITYTSFSVSAAKDGTELAALPEVAYTGMRLGAGLDAPLLDDKLRLALNLAYIPVFSAGEIISADYFPEGSAWGIGVNASAGYRIVSPVEVRLAFSLDRYGLSFKSVDSDTYQAKGASDLLWSLSLGVGIVF